MNQTGMIQPNSTNVTAVSYLLAFARVLVTLKQTQILTCICISKHCCKGQQSAENTEEIQSTICLEGSDCST